MSTPPRNIFTIAPQASFLDMLAQELWRRNDGDGFSLSQTLILLPTRRACRHLGLAFARLSAGKPVLLPRMQPLGDIDEDEWAFTDTGDFNLPPAIAPLRRLMLLTQQIQRRDPTLSCDQAAQAAEALAHFLDQTQIEQCDMAKLPSLVERRELAEHWQKTLVFLEIVTRNWPIILEEQGCMDPAQRRNAVLAAQSVLWRTNPPDFPIIAAGSTGSVPATAALLEVIAGLPQGAVILPGLDHLMDEEAWQKVGDTHPQHGMKRLLEKMQIDRADVKNWSNEELPSPRADLLRAAMRPADLTDHWRDLRGTLTNASVEGLHSLTLDHPQEEAQVIALRLRQFLELPDQTAALVTADRALAVRVAALLRRWNIEVDDSGGTPLSQVPAGSFLTMTLNASAPHAGLIDFLALLKHPLAACGQPPVACRAQTREHEIDLRHGHKTDFTYLKKLLQPLHSNAHDILPLQTWIELHRRTAETLAASDKEDGAARLWRGESGQDCAAWLNEWYESASDFPTLSYGDYHALFNALAASKALRTTRARHPRLSILGPLEARLIKADLIILGGMNEGTWPPDPGFDPWMSRPMRKDFGLPSPEFRIGLSAHDFVHLACAKNVLITRALRARGTPTTPSRFVLQIDAVLRAVGLSDDKRDALAPTEPWRIWTRLLDQPDSIEACERPRPCPPVENRPRVLSVTDIGTWLRNPYAIYAKYILGLRKLEELDAELNASDRGTLIHKALEHFVRELPQDIPPNAHEKLITIGRDLFAKEQIPARLHAFWWARFIDIATWFIAHESIRRTEGIKPIATECSGILVCDGLTLKGRADRIDRLPNATFAIIDYKTGAVPKKKEVTSGIEPQLPLLALIAHDGGFDKIAAAEVGSLEYWGLKGGRSGNEIVEIQKDIPDLVVEAKAGLRNLIATFRDPKTVYEAVPRPRLQPKYDDYAHLARLAEWGRIGGDEK